ncbi:MAG: hypothetical protein BGO02_03945 [Brevundimonas sp. 67-6]|nr:MAG: hypothetical protein BGO02_03945 [Brevundimonas sp. 67-6]
MTMSPREKVARIVAPKAWTKFDRFSGFADHVAREQQVSWSQHLQPSLKAADAILAALASSGDHAELARLAEAATPGPWFRGHNEHGSSHGEMSVWPDAGMVGGVIAKCGWQAPWDGWFEQPAKDAAFIAAANPATVLALIAEVSALRGAKWEVQHVDTMNDMVLLGMARDDAEARATEAERKLAEAVGLLNETAEEFGGTIDQYHMIGPDWSTDDGEMLNASALLDREPLIERICTFLSSKGAERG